MGLKGLTNPKLRAKDKENINRSHYSKIFLELAYLVHDFWGLIATFCDFPSYLHYREICLTDDSYFYLVDKTAEILVNYLFDDKEGIEVTVQTNDLRHEMKVFVNFPTVFGKIYFYFI
jgi:hypothetical protein